jgi:hypothetical protein
MSQLNKQEPTLAQAKSGFEHFAANYPLFVPIVQLANGAIQVVFIVLLAYSPGQTKVTGLVAGASTLIAILCFKAALTTLLGRFYK